MVSIIVPAFNAESTIVRILNSLLNQTYHEIEVIVVNDGSTDNTREVLDNYVSRHDRVTVIHTRNQGVTSARLTGVENATGEWIGFVDSDDEVEHDMYEILVNNAEKYGADISHCGFQKVCLDGKVKYFHNSGCILQQDKLTGLKDLLDGSLVEPGLCNKLFRKTLFNTMLCTDVMDRSIKLNEDLLMNYILFSESNKSVFQDVCKYRYFVNDLSASRSGLDRRKLYDLIRVRQIMMDMQIEGMSVATRKAYINICIIVYTTIVNNGNHQFEHDRKEVRDLIKEHKSWISLMGKKQQLLAFLILYFPTLHKHIYRFYAKHFQKKRYE